MASMKPAAMVEPMVPAILGPMACIRRKFDGLAFCPIICDTRAAMGTAATPAEPISGLTSRPSHNLQDFSPENPSYRRQAEGHEAEANDGQVLKPQKRLAAGIGPHRNGQEDNDGVHDGVLGDIREARHDAHSRNRFPSISIPIRGATEGKRSEQTMVTIMGKITFSVLDT